MNIHFDNTELFEKLKKASFCKVTVGSFLYGTNHAQSDIDYLYIYATSKNELLSPFKSYHQLQYKENGVDHLFVSIHNFIGNTMNGDSPINYEVIQSDSLDDTDLSWVSEYKKMFTTYNIVRGYLGICRRDIRHYGRQKTDYDKRKKLGHIIRGYMYAKAMIEHNFNFNSINSEFKKMDIIISTNNMLKDYTNRISSLRLILNEKFENKTLGLDKIVNVEMGIQFSYEFISFCESDTFKIKQNHLGMFDISEYVNVYENWVKY